MMRKEFDKAKIFGIFDFEIPTALLQIQKNFGFRFSQNYASGSYRKKQSGGG